jgi:AraC-like DNA-binding protein
MTSGSYGEYAPSRALLPHVACYWSLEEGSAPHRVLPDGCMDFLFDLSAGSATLVGTMTHALVAAASPGTRLFGVRFRPGEAFAFVNARADEATDRAFPLSDALGRYADALSDELASGASTRACVASLDRRLGELRARARAPDWRVRHAVERLVHGRGRARIARLAGELGLGERQLERVFTERVGIGPKRFARVACLKALLPRLHEPQRGTPWTRIAHDLGYADQSHMIREVRRLAGVTPQALAETHAMSDLFNSPREP